MRGACPVDRHPHLSVEPCELPDGIQLVYADDHGLRHAITLEGATAVDFDRIRAVRQPPTYRGQRNFPGLERHHIIEADHDPGWQELLDSRSS
jgi:hypothetical protein